MIIDINRFQNQDSAKAFIDECENNFKITVESAAKLIAADKNCKAVTLAGPTCSGKTTAASLLIKALKDLGKNAKIISIDDFYYSHDVMESLGITDFEGVSAIDTALFKETARSLAEKKETLLPTYDFKTRMRASLLPYTPDDNDIYIFEGIQAIYPEILSCLDSFKTVSLYISVADKVEIGDVCFLPDEIRLMRRAVRDNYHRGTSVENTMVLWDNVRANEEANIFPYVGKENFSINSLIPYELFIVGKEFLFLSENYPSEGKSYSLVEGLRERLSKIMNEHFSISQVPENSLLWEFSK